MRNAGLLLAAGQSRRFGAADKLLWPVGGRPLVTHAARAMRDAQFDDLVAVVSDDAVAAQLPGFVIVKVEDAAPSQALSLRTGIRRVRALGAVTCTVVLGDMPFVSATMLHDVATRCTDTSPSATTDGRRTMPPACFPKQVYDVLLAMTGDRGAADLIHDLDDTFLAQVASEVLHDIDTPQDLVSLMGLWRME
jgi:molybdenum cofactor cytidylyltransferase